MIDVSCHKAVGIWLHFRWPKDDEDDDFFILTVACQMYECDRIKIDRNGDVREYEAINNKEFRHVESGMVLTRVAWHKAYKLYDLLIYVDPLEIRIVRNDSNKDGAKVTRKQIEHEAFCFIHEVLKKDDWVNETVITFRRPGK